MSQGAAMAVEDGAALAAALDFANSPSDIMQALKLWESVRIERSSQMQEASLVNGKLWHFPDGPLQRARDDGMKADVDGQPYDRSSNQWSDPVTQRWAYGYDAVDAVSLVGRVMGVGKADSSPNGTKTNGYNHPS
jgi:salicylate hydroxylase